MKLRKLIKQLKKILDRYSKVKSSLMLVIYGLGIKSWQLSVVISDK